MIQHFDLSEAEDTEFGITEIKRSVRPGDTVRLSPEWLATITQAGLDCDCGKGVLCPLNPQERVSGFSHSQPLRYHSLDLIDRRCFTCEDWPEGESRLDHLLRTAWRPAMAT